MIVWKGYLVLNDRLYQYEIITSECTIGQTTMIWLCGNITSIPRPGNTLHIRPGHYSSCSSWLQLSPSCRSLDNSGHISGLYWQNVIIFHQPPAPARVQGMWKFAVLAVEQETNLRKVWSFTIMEKVPSRAFSWLKASTSTFKFKTLSTLQTNLTVHHDLYVGVPISCLFTMG